MLLVPLRVFVVPRLGFTAEELAVLDGPAASPFVSRSKALVECANNDQTMESVGGSI
jgi:hypothetical protein